MFLGSFDFISFKPHFYCKSLFRRMWYLKGVVVKGASCAKFPPVFDSWHRPCLLLVLLQSSSVSR